MSKQDISPVYKLLKARIIKAFDGSFRHFQPLKSFSAKKSVPTPWPATVIVNVLLKAEASLKVQCSVSNSQRRWQRSYQEADNVSN